ncbi:hypothetical protein HNY73_023245 [Argiope bruennichi]|uniref:Uncharacterized protein n=1 Tax=Argiope bruennichi TaxID=94029 RepID=A0A8T0E7S9_ARGBR|nr:hypothetical protein HNY73_023245 [Argiope bruennichi]
MANKGDYSTTPEVCELHFKEEDIIRNMEHFHEEIGCILKAPLKYPRLKPDAAPVYVKDYLQPTISQARETPEDKEMRLEDTAVRKAIAESKIGKSNYDKKVNFKSIPQFMNCLKYQNLNPFRLKPAYLLPQENPEEQHATPTCVKITPASQPAKIQTKETVSQPDLKPALRQSRTALATTSGTTESQNSSEESSTSLESCSETTGDEGN